MFQEVQRTYRRYINRPNLFSYSYVLNKMLKILKKEEHVKYLKYFKLLKYKWKLREYDDIWRKICREKGWEFYSSL